MFLHDDGHYVSTNFPDAYKSQVIVIHLFQANGNLIYCKSFAWQNTSHRE